MIPNLVRPQLVSVRERSLEQNLEETQGFNYAWIEQSNGVEL
jgi:hypothetical protein